MNSNIKLSDLINQELINSNKELNVEDIIEQFANSKEKLREYLIERRVSFDRIKSLLSSLDTTVVELLSPTTAVEKILIDLRERHLKAKTEFFQRRADKRKALLRALKFAIIKRDVVNILTSLYRIQTLKLMHKDLVMCEIEEQIQSYITVALDDGIRTADRYALDKQSSELQVALNIIACDIQSLETLLEN